MNENELLILNAEEVRRRSIIVWNGIPDDRLDWKPDAEAMSCIEMVRHVLEGEHLYTQMIETRGSVPQENSPFAARPFVSVADELAFARSYREKYLQILRGLSAEDLSSVEIDRSDVGYRRKLGDFILRIAYHESVHCGQMLSYLRTVGVPRPRVWD